MLHSAANNPSVTLPILRLLIGYGADPSAIDSYGCSCLMLFLLVAQTLCIQTVDYLISQGCNPRALNSQKWSLLHFAAANPYCSAELITHLVGYGCDVNAKTAQSESVIGLYLERALEFDPTVVQILI